MNVSIVPCADYSEEQTLKAIKNVLEPIGGLDRIKPGMKIAVKANLVSFMKPDSAATTHPALLCALVRLLNERGAEVTIGDSPGGLFTHTYVSGVYAATGMKQTEAAGGKLNRDFSQRDADYPQGVSAKRFTYTAWLDNADAIINFSKLKTHGMMSLSAAVKNMFGVIPGTMKPEYHYLYPDPAEFADMLIDLNEYFKPCISICDAVTGMEGNGPTAGTPRKIGAVIASESPYALDMLAAALIGLEPSAVPTLSQAVKRGLVPDSVEKLTVSGDWKSFVIDDFKLVEQTGNLRFNRDSEKFFGKLSARFMDRCLASRPTLEKEKCVGCKKCKDICPAHAISMNNKRPNINRKACIRCFCCQEFCPKGALTVKRPAIARILLGKN